MSMEGPAALDVSSSPPSPTPAGSPSSTRSVVSSNDDDFLNSDESSGEDQPLMVLVDEEGGYHTADASPQSPDTPPSEVDPFLMRAKQLAELHLTLKVIAHNPMRYDGPEPISSLLDRATDHAVDARLVEAATEAYEKAGPQLEARRRIRRAIDTVDASELRQSVLSVPRDCSVAVRREVEAAMALLRLMVWEAQLARIADMARGGCCGGGKHAPWAALGPLSDDVRAACDHVIRLESHRPAGPGRQHRAELVGLLGSEALADLALRRVRWSRLVSRAWRQGEDKPDAERRRAKNDVAAKERENEARRREAAVQAMIEQGMRRNTLRRAKTEAEVHLQASRSALRAARQQSAFLGSVLAVDKDFRRCWR